MKKEYPREKVVTGLADKFYDIVFALDAELVADKQEPATNHEIDIAWGALKYSLYKSEDDLDDTGYEVKEEEKE